ncbi:MAG: pilus assembly protein TadG-related protein, partial [Beijerinckiaceae bacterium]
MSTTRKLRELQHDKSGAIAILFALALAPMLTGIGVAIDYSRTSNARSAVVAAADAAALAGATEKGSAAQREAVARSVFETNLRSLGGGGHAVTPRYQNIVERGQNSAFRVEVDADINSLFGRFTGMATGAVKVAAQAKSISEDPAEIAFVLDTTDSMEGDRIDTLKTSVNGVFDEIGRRSARPGQIKVGVVPFGQYVNVGMARRSAPWLDVPADYRTPTGTNCHNVFDVIGETNCRNVNFGAEPSVPPHVCMRDGRPRMCGGHPGRGPRTERQCDQVRSTTPRLQCDRYGDELVTWHGCVGSRAHPLNTRDADYGTRIPGLLGIQCGSPILAMTPDLVSARSMINGLRTEGETYIPAGLIWGWRMLSPAEPLAAAPAPAGPSRKFMILVTDGRNTKSPTYPQHEGNDGTLADSLTQETCRNIAADVGNKITIFTVAFEMDGLAGKSIL